MFIKTPKVSKYYIYKQDLQARKHYYNISVLPTHHPITKQALTPHAYFGHLKSGNQVGVYSHHLQTYLPRKRRLSSFQGKMAS